MYLIFLVKKCSLAALEFRLYNKPFLLTYQLIFNKNKISPNCTRLDKVATTWGTDCKFAKMGFKSAVAGRYF